MKDSLPRIFSYLFMIAGLISLFSAFGSILIFVRYYFIQINELEIRTGFILLYILIASLILTGTFHYLSYKLDKEAN